MHALVAEAMKKAAIVWVSVAGDPAYPLWCLPIDDSLYVVSGGDEQQAPSLAGAARATVTARGDHGGRIVSWPATVATITSGADDWDTVATQLAGKRLNAPGTTEALVERWTTAATISRLTPIDDLVEAPSTDSGAAAPRPTPATSRIPKRFRLHRVKGQK